jgi:hypothetical protein
MCASSGKADAWNQIAWLRCERQARRLQARTRIRRHIKIRRDANPFDPQWRTYFEKRAFQKKFGLTRQQAGIKPS